MDTTAVQPERTAQPKPAPFHVIELAAGRRQVVVDGYGAFVGKKSERLVVRGRDGECLEVPFHDVERVTIATSGASLSSDAVQACCEEGIQLDFLSSNGHPYAKVTSPTLTATIVTRREQLLAYYDERGVAVVTAIVTCKIRNQANLLKRLARSRRETNADLYNAIRDAATRLEAILVEVTSKAGATMAAKSGPSAIATAAPIDGLRASFLSAEGRAGHIYWDLVGRLVDGKVDFPGREHRGAADPLNAMLNYGYGILYQQVWGAILLAGLEPFAGFLHVDRPGKPSLVLDFVEIFRQPVVDRAILASLGKGFTPEVDADGRLDQATRRKVAERVLGRLEDTETYGGKKQRVRNIIQMEARALATTLRREGPFRGWVCPW
jgi:CRISPR-associated protein Cas1